MRKILKQQKGETLVETLVALLIATFSVMMLTASITSSARINKQNSNADDKYTEELKRVESYEADAGFEAKEIQIKFDFGNGTTIVKDAILYGGEDGRLASYKAKEEAGP